MRISTPYIGVALEYLALSDTSHWEFVPHILTLRNPSDERLITQSRKLAKLFRDEAEEHRQDIYAHRLNLIIELRERRKEVMKALASMPQTILQDAIMPMGLKTDRYRMGIILRPRDVKKLLSDADFRNCDIRPVSLQDFSRVVNLRAPALRAA